MIREKENCKPSKGKKGAKSFIFKKKGMRKVIDGVLIQASAKGLGAYNF